MNSKEIDELLSALICKYAGSADSKLLKKVVKKLDSNSVNEQIAVLDNGYAKVLAAMQQCGTIVKTEESEETAVAVIMAGAAGMNPAVVAAKVEGHFVYIKATAKEGLIKQHTAEKAIGILKTVLRELE